MKNSSSASQKRTDSLHLEIGSYPQHSWGRCEAHNLLFLVHNPRNQPCRDRCHHWAVGTAYIISQYITSRNTSKSPSRLCKKNLVSACLGSTHLELSVHPRTYTTARSNTAGTCSTGAVKTSGLGRHISVSV